MVEWNSPGVGSAWAFTAGLLFSSVCPVLIADAVLRYAHWRSDAPTSALVWVAYLSTVGLAGVVPALFFDPAVGGCPDCPANLLLIGSRPQAVEYASRAAVYAGVVWAAMLAGVLGWRLVRASAARRRAVGLVVAPALLYLGAVGIDYLQSWGRGYLGTNDLDRRLWAIQGGLLILVALGSGWSFVRRRRTRSAVARLVVAASDVATPGGLDTSLGAAVGDGSLRVLYPLGEGRWVDGAGRPVEPDGGAPMTRLTRVEAGHPGLVPGPRRDDRQIGLALLHRPDRVDLRRGGPPAPSLVAGHPQGAARQCGQPVGVCLHVGRLAGVQQAQGDHVRRRRAARFVRRAGAPGDRQRSRRQDHHHPKPHTASDHGRLLPT